MSGADDTTAGKERDIDAANEPGAGAVSGAGDSPRPAFVPAATAVAQVAAPAKINLGLLVGPVRSDGFHEIFSPMLPVTLADLVTARPAPAGAGLAVECDVAPGEDNLAAKAVRELERRLGRSFDVRLSIAKRVPAAAGLGGGSSDAAAALTAVERLFGSTCRCGCATRWPARSAPTCPSSSGPDRNWPWGAAPCSKRSSCPSRCTS